jgi:hypothetical protein
MQDQDYAGAVEEFRAALALDPRPEMLYAMAQAERMMGDCATAIDDYRAFLASRPADEFKDYAETNITNCQAELDREAEAKRAPHPEPPPPEPAPLPPPPRPHARPWYRDWLGDALCGAGVIGLAVGGFEWSSGHADAAAVGEATDHQTFVERSMAADSALTRQRIGVGALIAGAALVAAGVTHYLVVQPTEGGATVVAGGRF